MIRFLVRLGLENYTFLTPEMAVAGPYAYAGPKRQFLKGFLTSIKAPFCPLK